jgi:hypothetical protein
MIQINRLPRPDRLATTSTNRTHRIRQLTLPQNRGGIDYKESHAGEAEEV